MGVTQMGILGLLMRDGRSNQYKLHASAGFKSQLYLDGQVCNQR